MPTETRSGQFATEGTVFDVAVSDDGSRVAVASEDRHVYMLDGEGAELWRHNGAQSFGAVAMTPDGAIVIAGSDDRTVTAFDAAGTVLWEYTASDIITETAVYGGARAYRALAGTRDSRVILLDAQGQQLWERRLDFAIRGLGVTPNGAAVVTADDNGNISLLDGTNGQPTWTVSGDGRANAAAISRDGATIVAATRSGAIVVLDAERRKQTRANDLRRDQRPRPPRRRRRRRPRHRGPDHLRHPIRRRQLRSPSAGRVVRQMASLRWHHPGGSDSHRGRPRPSPPPERRARLARLSPGRHPPGPGNLAWPRLVSLPLPTVTMLLIFNYYPALSGIYHAFTVWTPGVETRWVGLDQFRALGDDRYFWTGIGNLIILIVTGFLKLILPLVVAELIFNLRSHKLRYAMRTLFVLQVIVPGVVGVLLWVNIYDPQIGLANQVLRGIGLDSWAQVWLGDSDTALWSIVVIGFPWVSAFALLIFYGGLISIPGEIFDAAQVDGAGPIRRFFNIDLPLLLSQVRLLVILTFIAVVQEFAAVFLTTGGGPGSSTYVPSLELYYQAVRFNNFGLASAIGAVLFVVILIGTIINLRYVKSSVEYGV